MDFKTIIPTITDRMPTTITELKMPYQCILGSLLTKNKSHLRLQSRVFYIIRGNERSKYVFTPVDRVGIWYRGLWIMVHRLEGLVLQTIWTSSKGTFDTLRVPIGQIQGKIQTYTSKATMSFCAGSSSVGRYFNTSVTWLKMYAFWYVSQGQESMGHCLVLECTELEARTVIFLLPIDCYETGGAGKILLLLDI